MRCHYWIFKLTHRRHLSSPRDFFGNDKNIGFPSCNLFFKARWSKWGNLESLLHPPQQQCFAATICSIKYPTTHRFSSCRIIVLSAMFVRPLLGVQKWRNLFLVRPRVAIDSKISPSLSSWRNNNHDHTTVHRTPYSVVQQATKHRNGSDLWLDDKNSKS